MWRELFRKRRISPNLKWICNQYFRSLFTVSFRLSFDSRDPSDDKQSLSLCWAKSAKERHALLSRVSLVVVVVLHEQIFWLFVIIFHSIRTWRFYGLSMFKMKRSWRMEKSISKCDLKRLHEWEDRERRERKKPARDYKLFCFLHHHFLRRPVEASNKPAWTFSDLR